MTARSPLEEAARIGWATRERFYYCVPELRPADRDTMVHVFAFDMPMKDGPVHRTYSAEAAEEWIEQQAVRSAIQAYLRARHDDLKPPMRYSCWQLAAELDPPAETADEQWG